MIRIVCLTRSRSSSPLPIAIAPREVRTGQIVRGVLPFIVLIVVMCLAVALFPSLVMPVEGFASLFLCEL